MGGNYEKDIYKHLMEMMERYESLEKDLKSVKASTKSEIRSLKGEVSSLTEECSTLKEENTRLREQVDFLESENALLKEENVRLHSILHQDSNNSSLPPSTDQKPSKKKANEYNGRQTSGKKTGGQKGHPGTTLSKKSVEEKIRSGQFRHTVENRVNGEPVTG